MSKKSFTAWWFAVALLPALAVVALAAPPQGGDAQNTPLQGGASKPAAPASGLGAALPWQPLTVGGKLKYALNRGLGPTTALGAFATGGYQQYFNRDRGFGQGAEGYFSRVGSNYGTAASRQVFGSFALAAMFRQDPRYIPSGRSSAKARLGYALSRVVVTRGDNGRAQFNISGIGGTVGAAFLANVWHEPPDDIAARALRRAGVSLAVDGLWNVIREFWPELRRKLGLKN